MSIAPISIGTISDVVPSSVIVPPIDYTTRDYASLVSEMLNLIPSYLPEWTDRSPGDFGIVMLELFAYVGDILNFYIDRIANEAFLSTAQQMSSVLNLANLLDYTPYGNVAATTTLTFTIGQPSPTPLLIPQNTGVQTSLAGQAVVFETVQDLWIYGDGVFYTLNVTSNGNPNQQFFLGDTTGTIPWPTYVFTGGGSTQVVTVGGTTWTLAPGNSFINQAATATMFIVINGNTIVFGGGTTANPGAIPANGAAISITYSPTPMTGTTPNSQYYASVNALQGQSVIGENVGVSDGTANQVFTLFNTPVVEGSVQPPVNPIPGEVNGGVFVDEGQGPLPWIYFQRLVDALSSQAAYSLSTDSNGVVSVLFGDGIAGRIPMNGSAITANYMVGGGAIGNVAPNSITNQVVAIPGVISVTNPGPAFGGADAESIDHIRIHAPLSITAINRAVTLDDYAALILNIPSVAKASAVSTAYNAVNIYIHPAGNFIQSVATLQNSVNALIPTITNSAQTGYLDDKKMVQVSVNVLPPMYNNNGVLSVGYVPVNISAMVQVLPQYSQATVVGQCLANVRSLLTFAVVDFGYRVSLSSVYHAIMQTEGVDYVNVTVCCRNEVTPQVCADVVCANYEIPQAGLINNTTILGNGGI